MKRLLLPFYKTGLWILDRIPVNEWKEKRREERLRAFYPGRSYSVKEYYAGRLAVVFAVLFWGTGAAIFIELAAGGETSGDFHTQLIRPAYGEGSRETELEAIVEGEEEGAALSIQISEKEYTAEEIQGIFRQLTERMEQEILGENESLEEVRSALHLPSTLNHGTVAVEWIISPADLLDGSGAIQKEVGEEGEVAELRALLSYRGQKAEYTGYAHIYPPIRTERETLEKRLLEVVHQADEEGIHENSLILPQEIDGRKISWVQPEVHVGISLTALALIGAVLAWYYQEQNLKKREKERRRQLLLDYPEVLFKMAMLLGAGLTLKGAFQKIAAEYTGRRGKRPRYVYEEIRFTCREMENGVGEAAAYENFGRRCGDSRYVKLGSVFSQNLKKGAKGMQEFLEQEAAAGFEERKNEARKMGEEAGTKLLLPMMVMLVLVLVILILPALMNF